MTASHHRAFSLIEVVLALAVIAFAITGIMGLFPVALRSALESQRETRATLIAQQIFSDLRASPSTNLLLATGTNLSSTGSFVTPPPSLSNAWTHVISFSDDGLPIANGATPNAIYVANISATPNLPVPGLTRVQVDVEAPPQASSTNRSRYTFLTLLRQ
jgi:prepilin-type N-terminal cleavage/methylation domain-containing protein